MLRDIQKNFFGFFKRFKVFQYLCQVSNQSIAVLYEGKNMLGINSPTSFAIDYELKLRR